MIGRPFLVILPFLFCVSMFGADPVPGAATFLSNCAFCHAVNGRGGRGPSLVSARVVQNTSDDAIKAIVKNGIPGTGMPAFDIETDELEPLVLYIRHLGGGGVKTAPRTGDIARGRKVFAAQGCSNCHRVGDTGSVYGPELTRAGSARSPEYLRESIVNPSADIAQDYDGVTVLTREGKKVTGVRVNEDSFSVQIRTPDQRFAMFDKSTVRSVEDLDRSLMPAYQLPTKDLDDLVAYLYSLRGDAAGADATKAPGIH